MKTATSLQQRAPRVSGGQVARAVVKLDEARAIYVQSGRRLDLATLAKAFETAPESNETAGKVPKD